MGSVLVASGIFSGNENREDFNILEKRQKHGNGKTSSLLTRQDDRVAGPYRTHSYGDHVVRSTCEIHPDGQPNSTHENQNILESS